MRKDVGVRLVLHGGRGDKRIVGTVESTGGRLTLHNVALLKYFVGISSSSFYYNNVDYEPCLDKQQ